MILILSGVLFVIRTEFCESLQLKLDIKNITMKNSILKVLASAAFIAGLITSSTTQALAQTNGGLEKVDKVKTKKDKAVIEYDVNDFDANDPNTEEAIKNAKANQSKANDDFKKQKTKIDKAKTKLNQMKAKLKQKLTDGSITTEKYNKMMDKIGVKEAKLSEKTQKAIQSLKSSM